MVAGLAMAVGLELVSIATLSSAIFLIVFAVVNAAAFKAAADLKANRIVTGLGVLGCIGSFLVLIAQAATQDIVALASLAALLTFGLRPP